MLLIFLSDILRQSHFGFNLYMIACAIELYNFVFTIFLLHYFTSVVDWDFTGCLVALNISQLSITILYSLSFIFNPGFQIDGKRFIDHFKSNSGENKPEKISTNEPPTPKNMSDAKKDVAKFDNLDYFLKIEFQFAAMFFLEQGWVRVDNILASMVYQTPWIAALTAFFNFLGMLDCFSFGYGFATVSQITKYLVAGQVKKAKVVALWSMILMVVTSAMFSFVINLYHYEIADMF